MKLKKLKISAEGVASGVLHRESQYIFNYATHRMEDAVSLTMPLSAASYTQTPLMPVFAMNLPEGYLFDMIARRMAKHENFDDMQLLAITGKQQIGRLTFEDENDQSPRPKSRFSLQQILHQPSSVELFAFLVEEYFDSGISGVQPKVMLPDAQNISDVEWQRKTMVSSDLIVKSAGDEYPFLTQNEFMCMDAARRAGITVPDCSLSDDGKLFVMRRFDLEPDRRGFEDMAVLMSKNRDQHGNYKYEGSYENIVRAIRLFSGITEAQVNAAMFFEYLVHSVMVRNGDAHLKNFGMLYKNPNDGKAFLAPLYDVVTTTIYPYYSHRRDATVVDRTMALKLFNGPHNKSYPLRSELIKFGEQVCLVRNASETIDRIATAIMDTLHEHISLLDTKHATAISDEWHLGVASLEPTRVFMTRHAPEDDSSDDDNAMRP